MDKKKLLEFKTTKELMYGMMAYNSGSILGPLLVFGTIGFFLDKFFDKKPLFLLIGVLVAFVFTNVLIFKRIRKLMKEFEKQMEKDRKRKQELLNKNKKIN